MNHECAGYWCARAQRAAQSKKEEVDQQDGREWREIEQEGLLSVLLLRIPRGLVVAQKSAASIHADLTKGTRSK